MRSPTLAARRTVGAVSDEKSAVDRGVQIRERRERLGMSARELAKEAQIDRGRLAKIEKGDESVRATTYGPVLATLDRLEHEMSMDMPEGARRIGDPDEGLIEISMGGVYGVQSIIVKGPVANVEVLKQTARDLIRDIRADNPEPETKP